MAPLTISPCDLNLDLREDLRFLRFRGARVDGRLPGDPRGPGFGRHAVGQQRTLPDTLGQGGAAVGDAWFMYLNLFIYVVNIDNVYIYIYIYIHN